MNRNFIITILAVLAILAAIVAASPVNLVLGQGQGLSAPPPHHETDVRVGVRGQQRGAESGESTGNLHTAMRSALLTAWTVPGRTRRVVVMIEPWGRSDSDVRALPDRHRPPFFRPAGCASKSSSALRINPR